MNSYQGELYCLVDVPLWHWDLFLNFQIVESIWFLMSRNISRAELDGASDSDRLQAWPQN